ncbi:MAG TPA: glycine--tRNA ligase subunit beta [Trueperaceae bacterium]
MPNDLLFEIGTEELPSWYVLQGRDALVQGISEALSEARLGHGEVVGYATPRRLAVLVKGLTEESERRSEKRRGPPASAGIGPDGSLTRAALGFAQANGVEPSELTVEETGKGEYLFAVKEVGGEPAARLLPAILSGLVENLPAPRKMRWAEVETAFVRPVSWLLALLGGEPIELEAAGVTAGRCTRGHRFLAPEALEIQRPADYVDRLRDAYVIADVEERRRATWESVCTAATAEGLEPLEDEGLLDEVTSLVEAPFAVLGEFDERYLELPDELLATVMIHHQRYFPVRSKRGALAAGFVSVSNNRVPDVSLIREGYERVLAGRLYDARFFWDADRTKSLSQHAWGLSGIQFHGSLGTMAEKVSRVGETARRLAPLVGLDEAEEKTLEQALPIYRADLATSMIFEFPELEGVMARAYAVAEGLDPLVGRALEEGVKPKGPEDSLPQEQAGALLSAADRLDKLLGFFAVGKRGSGSADPFGLRRDALGLVRILASRGWEVPPRPLLETAAQAYASNEVVVDERVIAEVERFIWDRVATLLADEGIGVHLVRAATGDQPPVITAARRAHLLQAMSAEEAFPAFMTLYKRAANLAEKAPAGVDVDPGLFEVAEEAPLNDALAGARKGIEELLDLGRSLDPWDLGGGPESGLPPLDAAIAKVLQVKDPLDAFLDDVLVMVDQEDVRNNRLALLREVRDALRALGRLEELEGI